MFRQRRRDPGAGGCAEGGQAAAGLHQQTGELLGEPIDAPISQPLGPRGASGMPWLDPSPPGSGGFVISGLGCPNMCEFCCTSHFYGGEYIEIAKAERLFQGMKRIWMLRVSEWKSS